MEALGEARRAVIDQANIAKARAGGVISAVMSEVSVFLYLILESTLNCVHSFIEHIF